MSNQQKAINGAKWTSTASGITTALSFLQLAVLARLLEPTMFGLVSICTMILNFFHIFANLGFSNSIIYKQETDRKILSTIFYTSIGLGMVIFLLMNMSSFLVAAFYNEPKLTIVIRIAAFGFPVMSIGQIYWILLQKELKFKELAIIEVLSILIGTISTLLGAYWGLEELSLIYGQLIASSLRTLSYVLIGRNLFKPMLYFRLREIKDHLVFGVYNIGQGILNFFSGNMENIVIGKAISLKALGYYTIAYQLAVFPISRLNPIIMQVSYPIMAKMKDNEGLKRAYLKIVDFISFCNFPLLAGLFITSAAIIPLIYGEGWEMTVSLTKIIVLVSFMACINAPVDTLAYSKGKPSTIFYLNLSLFFFKLPVIYLFATFYGLTGIAYGYVLVYVTQTIAVSFIVKNLIGNIFFKLTGNLAKPLLFCLIMVLTIFMYQQFIGNGGWLHTIAQIVLGGSVYIALTLAFKISYKELLSLRKSL